MYNMKNDFDKICSFTSKLCLCRSTPEIGGPACEGTPGPSSSSADQQTSEAGTSSAHLQTPGPSFSSADPLHHPTNAEPIDPADWRSVLTDAVRTGLVLRGPFQISSDFTFSKRKDGRSHYMYRTLVNGENQSEVGLSTQERTMQCTAFAVNFFPKRIYD